MVAIIIIDDLRLTKLAYPKKKNSSKGGGEYHNAESGTEHKPVP